MTDLVYNMLSVSDRYYKGEINLEQACQELEEAGSVMNRKEMTEALIKGGRNNIHEFPFRFQD